MEFVDKNSRSTNIKTRNKAVTETLTSSVVRNTMDSMLMSDVPPAILKQVQILITAIKR